ncbi:isoprenylcysteine carboxylmethyltransferase family protein [Jiella sonneratiae]|uniref:DUF1295 domain-containing protein n=1 Tax=Jiella sonneratiae TaxID=2816856 RepID=A0ABS3JCL6_9HYPH|nr:isoprenylcysteine carboxylmethyltransferase family protein [Jiella sonneratiae]MBO0906311.1 DUF1295 domain-containing protein [Jiella sonneratiae]
MLLALFVAAAVLVRLASVLVSARHERALRADGAVEVGAGVTRTMAAAHGAFMIAGALEAYVRQTSADALSAAGLVLYLFGIAMLVVVMRLLGRFWTVKVMIARDHRLVTHPLFRAVRHPNYFLNILPELVGYGLVLHAFWTLAIGLPLYLVVMVARIRQEEAAMRGRFADYAA